MSADKVLEIVRALPPDADGLLRIVSSHVDDEMLREIAAADYGTRVDEHLAPLKALRDTGSFPESWRSWCPMEVVELIRWSQPDDPNWRPGRHGPRGHWMRAFATLCILRYRGQRGGEIEYENTLADSLAPLVVSLAALNEGLGSELAGFCAWLASRFDEDVVVEDAPTLAAAILIAALQLGFAMPSDMAEELALSAAEAAQDREDGYWLYEKPWKSLAKALRNVDLADSSPALRNGLEHLLATLDHSISPQMLEWLEERRREIDAWVTAQRERPSD